MQGTNPVSFLVGAKKRKAQRNEQSQYAKEIRALGEYIRQLLDFSGMRGLRYYTFAPDEQNLRASFVDSSKVYGDTKDKADNEIRNYKKFIKDAGIFAENVLKTHEALNDEFFETAVSDLKAAGWIFADRP
jgi:hypothetical protein